MATINYLTIQVPEILWKYSELIQKTPSFEVRKYTHRSGIIFRIPNELKPGEVCHAFIEHEINMSNTLRTGTLTMKVQVTFVPCHMGVFSGYERLEGGYTTNWYDEEYGDDVFVPDYKNQDNVKNIVPLPVNLKTNLFEYLNEILFKHSDDAKTISRYAVDLGCKAKHIQDNLIPAPTLSSTSKKSALAHQKTIDFFNSINTNSTNLLPDGNE